MRYPFARGDPQTPPALPRLLELRPVLAGDRPLPRVFEEAAMNAARLLDRLKGSRRTGPARWIANCPAHEDRSPSLCIRELDDGTLLIKCFAGCSATDVVAAVGLELRDLFPERVADHCRRPSRAWLDARDVLACLSNEGQILAIAASDLARGLAFSSSDADRIARAVGRIRAAWGMFNGHR